MDWMNRYAQLLVHYCLSVRENDVVLVRSTPLATPLLQPLYAEILACGAQAEFLLTFENQDSIFYNNVQESHIADLPHFYPYSAERFTHSLTIDAPYCVKELARVSSSLKSRRRQAFTEVKRRVMQRSADGEFRWALCVFPTESMATEAGMTVPEFESFVQQACFLHTEDAISAWKDLGKTQQRVTDFLNTKSQIRYVGPGTDISFSTLGRKWINSDGKRNMPSGEVFTSPVETSVNGHITFNYPTLYEGRDVSTISLEVVDGVIMSWSAFQGQDVLDEVFQVPGARVFGEAAIGMNPHIQQPIKDILFDEKIGGSVHMAIGASYPEAGGKNESAVHWDMITDMKNGGHIYADEQLIYKNGLFIF